MATKAQLKFCEICKNHTYDMGQGIICKLTNKPADFEETCNSFSEDSALVTTDLERLEKEISNRAASLGKRLVNYIIDFIFILIFGIILIIIIGIPLAIVAPSFLSFLEQDNIFIDYLLGIIFGMAYYTLTEATTGKTIGKMITKTKVVNELGEKPDFKTILIRSLCRNIPFEIFSFFNSENSGWHDKLSNTKVIEE